MSHSILVFDEQSLRREIHVFGLRCAGFTVSEVSNVAAATAQIELQYPDLILVVGSHLEPAAWQFIRALRSDFCTRDLPVLVAVEHECQNEINTARELRISCCLRLPAPPATLIARIRTAIEAKAIAMPAVERIAGLILDSEERVARRGGLAVALGPMEQRLLEVFLAHPDQLISRQQLISRVWGTASGVSMRVVDINVCRLRRALKQLRCEKHLHTVRHLGYRFALHLPSRHSYPKASLPTGVHQ